MPNRRKRARKETTVTLETAPPSKSRTRSTLASKLAKLTSVENLDSSQSSLAETQPLNRVDKAASSSSGKRYWLMKSEPESRIENGHEMKFGIDDLKAMPEQITHWDGVRNFEARNHMKAMRVGDQAFFYHSNCKNPGLIGVMRVCKEAYVDHTQFDPNDAHYDPKSPKENPKWFMVDVKFERDLKRFIPLSEIKTLHLEHKNGGKNGDGGGPLKNLSLFTRSRLSVQSLTEDEWNYLIGLEDQQ